MCASSCRWTNRRSLPPLPSKTKKLSGDPSISFSFFIMNKCCWWSCLVTKGFPKLRHPSQIRSHHQRGVVSGQKALGLRRQRANVADERLLKRLRVGPNLFASGTHERVPHPVPKTAERSAFPACQLLRNFLQALHPLVGFFGAGGVEQIPTATWQTFNLPSSIRRGPTRTLTSISHGCIRGEPDQGPQLPWALTPAGVPTRRTSSLPLRSRRESCMRVWVGSVVADDLPERVWAGFGQVGVQSAFVLAVPVRHVI